MQDSQKDSVWTNFTPAAVSDKASLPDSGSKIRAADSVRDKGHCQKVFNIFFNFNFVKSSAVFRLYLLLEFDFHCNRKVCWKSFHWIMQKVLGLFLHKQPAHQAPNSDWTAQQVTKSSIQLDQCSHPETLNECSNATGECWNQAEEKTNQHHKPKKTSPHCW